MATLLLLTSCDPAGDTEILQPPPSPSTISSSPQAETAARCRSDDVNIVPQGPDGATGLVFSIRIDPRGEPCRFRRKLALTLTDLSGTQLDMRGNPSIVTFDAVVGAEQRVQASWDWPNWCKDQAGFTFFLTGRNFVEQIRFEGNPRCDFAQKRSRLAPIRPWMIGVESVETPDPSAATEVVADCFHGRVKPGRIALACADNGFRARNLIWTKWGRGGAVGRGVFRMNDCIPGCAAGTFRRRTGTIHLTERRYCLSLDHPVFMSGRVVFDEPFQGRSETDIYPGCPI